jgi:hypothetical protein
MKVKAANHASIDDYFAVSALIQEKSVKKDERF